MNGILGSGFSREEVESVFKRLALPYAVEDDVFSVTPPFERTDLTIPEDLAEEVGRIIGYDRVPTTELPAPAGAPDQARYRGIEKIKDQLVAEGYTEVSTQSFAKTGDIYLANPLDKENPALRKDLTQGIMKAGVAAVHYAPLFLPFNTPVKLFEFGTVFSKDGEHIELLKHEFSPKSHSLTLGHGQAKRFLSEDDIPMDASYLPERHELGAYKPFSVYPFIVRDIAFWAPADVNDGPTMSIIRENAGELLMRLDQFDRFEKEGRVSLAFRLVFQSMERTLTDEEINGVMAGIVEALTKAGYEVR
jgi:phenylalanyl-tRNA synthetase beta subunit